MTTTIHAPARTRRRTAPEAGRWLQAPHHRRPLAAFVVLAVVCGVVIFTGYRSDAVQSVIRFTTGAAATGLDHARVWTGTTFSPMAAAPRASGPAAGPAAAPVPSGSRPETPRPGSDAGGVDPAPQQHATRGEDPGHAAPSGGRHQPDGSPAAADVAPVSTPPGPDEDREGGRGRSDDHAHAGQRAHDADQVRAPPAALHGSPRSHGLGLGPDVHLDGWHAPGHRFARGVGHGRGLGLAHGHWRERD